MSDCIERMRVLEELQKIGGCGAAPGTWAEGWDKAIDEAYNRILGLPAADVVPRPSWIPADEELPPNGQEVLCWYEYFRFGQYNRMYQTFGIGYQFNGNWGGEVAQGRNAKVLAWMPLPEPPKEDNNENQSAD